mmetsp:Transcript_31204/g.47787  ORF Transcript_31204/g.47787 Transcript_31204/m.47787 type:complete len:90 (+) Transcript_31204:153-422(+)
MNPSFKKAGHDKKLSINFVNSEQVSFDDPAPSKSHKPFNTLVVNELRTIKNNGLLGKANKTILRKNNKRSPMFKPLREIGDRSELTKAA